MDPLGKMPQLQNFDFQHPSSRTTCFGFERYRVTNALKFVLGNTADDTLCGLTHTAEDKSYYEEVRGAFDNHFIGKKNVVYESLI